MPFRILVTFCLLISFFNASAQDEESQCVKIKNFSVEERNQNYPFESSPILAIAVWFLSTTFQVDYRL